MAKRLVLTDKQKEQIIAVAGDSDIDFSKIVAYESVAASTRPITQKSSPYHQAQMSEGFLREMAAHLANNSVTLQIMHNNEMLPIGKVFSAGVFASEAGHYELNSAFYLEADSEYVSKIDLGIIDEVSIGALPKHAYCSECAFDYMSDPYAMYYRECPDEHILGENGVHLRLTSLDTWKELSLVNRGASSKPKILGAAKQRLGSSEYQRLAASNSHVDLTYLSCTFTPNPETTTPKGNAMDPKMLELAQSVGRLESEKTTLEASLTASKAALDTAQIELAAVKVELAAEKAKVPADVEALKASEGKLTAFLAGQYKNACVAASIEFKEGASSDEMIAAIEQAQIKLAAIPRGGVTQPADQPEPVQLANYDRAAAFV